MSLSWRNSSGPLQKQSDATTDEWVERYSRFKKGSPPSGANRAAAASEGAAVPDAWKRWIGENKLLKTSDAAIVEVLKSKGFLEEAAVAEVVRAGADPYLQAGDWAVQRLKKTESLLGVYRALAKLRPNAGAVERRAPPSRDEFLDRYYTANRPVVIGGLMSDWKALRLCRSNFSCGEPTTRRISTASMGSTAIG